MIFCCCNILHNFNELHLFVPLQPLCISCSCTGGWTPGLFGASWPPDKAHSGVLGVLEDFLKVFRRTFLVSGSFLPTC